jgi:F-type H+-transporting ATPase subunit b
MLIDWFTVGAQAVNFLILVWLLQRFLYRPVLAAIEAREKKIGAGLADAAQKEAQARLEREELQRRTETLEHEREAILHAARETADAERQRLLEAARQDSQLLRAKLTDILAKDRQELGRQLVARTQSEVFAMTRKALADLADVSLEARMTEVFIGRLRDLPETQRRWSAGSHSAVVRSAFELAAPQRTELERALAQCLGSQVPVRFECSPELVCGVALTVDGVKLAWSVTDYLAQAAQEVLELTTAASVPAVALEARHG